jgi:adenylate cyclase
MERFLSCDKSGSLIFKNNMAPFFKKFFKFHPLLISLFFVVMGVAFYFHGVPFFELMELKTIDLRFQARGKKNPGPKVAIAVIDEKSLAREGKWMWPRSKFAQLINRLSDAGAAVIAFDVGFWEPDDRRTVKAIEDIQTTLKKLGKDDPNIETHINGLKSKVDYDRQLADAIKNSKAKIILGYFFQDYENIGHQTQEEIAVHEENIGGSLYQQENYTSEAALSAALIDVLIPQSNIALFSNATPYSGAINIFPDKDGVVRWMPSVLRYNGMLYTPVSLMALSCFLDAPLSVTIAEYGVESLKIGKTPIPVDEKGKIMVNYRGPQKTIPHISITDILQGKTPKENLRGKIILVGATATGVYDMRVTPFETVYPGVEIHANIIDNVLSQDFLQQPAWAAAYDVLAIIMAGLLLGLILPRTGVIWGTIAGLGLFSGHMFFCQYVFVNKGFVLNIIYPLTVILLTYLTITVYKYLSESRQKRFIKNAFSTYLAPSVVKQLVEQPDKLVLGGEEREITAFFSDVQGFTGISEKLSPRELVELLNEFLTEMTDIILAHEGTVDKFEGDAIIAFFGAPNEIKNHAEVACLSCIAMQKRMAQLRPKWKSEGKPEMKVRIGLCSGPAVVGNMGSKSRMDYTMMGDTVNTASRLEGVNKVYGSYTLIGESTYKQMGENMVARELDSINVVGKLEPIKIYQLIGKPDDVEKPLFESVAWYAKGLEAYRLRSWDQAIDFFDAALSAAPDDGPSRTMRSRCLEYKTTPPDENWNGSYTMTHK